ncbi:MAG: hypothetical protein ACFCBW_02485, partial [Candidatus Competibacterales bacterium]
MAWRVLGAAAQASPPGLPSRSTTPLLTVTVAVVALGGAADLARAQGFDNDPKVGADQRRLTELEGAVSTMVMDYTTVFDRLDALSDLVGSLGQQLDANQRRGTARDQRLDAVQRRLQRVEDELQRLNANLQTQQQLLQTLSRQLGATPPG